MKATTESHSKTILTDTFSFCSGLNLIGGNRLVLFDPGRYLIENFAVVTCI